MICHSKKSGYKLAARNLLVQLGGNSLIIGEKRWQDIFSMKEVSSTPTTLTSYIGAEWTVLCSPSQKCFGFSLPSRYPICAQPTECFLSLMEKQKTNASAAGVPMRPLPTSPDAYTLDAPPHSSKTLILSKSGSHKRPAPKSLAVSPNIFLREEELQ